MEESFPVRPRLRIGGIPIDAVRLGEAVEVVARLVAGGKGGLVFTPNVDHIVMASKQPAFHALYQRADLCVVDGMPVVWASHLMGAPLPEKVSGSDLLLPLVARAAAAEWRVFLLGAAEGVAAVAAERLRERYSNLKVVGTASPRIDMSRPALERRDLIDTLIAARPDVVFVALGAPKQEFLSAEALERVAAVFVGVGASFDFLAGTSKRAPAWMSRSGLEWAYRLGQEPKRLAFRYLVQDPKFLLILGRDLVAKATRRHSSPERHER